MIKHLKNHNTDEKIVQNIKCVSIFLYTVCPKYSYIVDKYLARNT
jgi:hypothetical protein